jgi:predicted nuclease of restriction endonuclease-like (RecB) superfamily
MSKTLRKNKPRNLAKPLSLQTPSHGDFDVVLGLIEAARTRAVAVVNTTLIDLYWSVGEFISLKIADDGWGKGTVESLAETIQRRYPGMTGYSAPNLWRMRQFYEVYCDQPKLAPLVRELSWTHNLLIMSRCKRDEEREFS